MRFIFKTDQSTDLYVEWSDVVDAPTFVGSREDLLRYLERTGPSSFITREPNAQRLMRVDETGTSMLRAINGKDREPLDGSWDDTGLVYKQIGWLRRHQFTEFFTLFMNEGETVATQLLDHFITDDEESR